MIAQLNLFLSCLLPTLALSAASAVGSGANLIFRPAAAADPNAEPISLQFRALSWGSNGGGETLFVPVGTDYRPIEGINRSRRSPQFYAYNGPNPVTVFREQVDAEGVKFYVPVLSQSVSPALKTALFLFVYRPEEPLPRAMAILDDSPEHFPWGSYQFVNMTTLQLGGLFNGERFDIRPLENKIIPISGDQARFLPFKLFYYNNAKSRWDNIAQNQWDFYPERRNLVFFHDNSVRYTNIATHTLIETAGDLEVAQKNAASVPTARGTTRPSTPQR